MHNRLDIESKGLVADVTGIHVFPCGRWLGGQLLKCLILCRLEGSGVYARLLVMYITPISVIPEVLLFSDDGLFEFWWCLFESRSQLTYTSFILKDHVFDLELNWNGIRTELN